jgi:hypothetical protein
MKFEFYKHIFEKYSNIKFDGNPFSGNQVLHADGQTERHEEANRRFSQFYESA